VYYCFNSYRIESQQNQYKQSQTRQSNDEMHDPTCRDLRQEESKSEIDEYQNNPKEYAVRNLNKGKHLLLHV